MVVVGVDTAQNGVGVHDRPLYTAVAVALAQGVHGFVDVLQLLALFLVGEKAQLHCAIRRAQVGTAHTDAAQGLRPRVIALEQIKGNAGNFDAYIGGVVQLLAARKSR